MNLETFVRIRHWIWVVIAILFVFAFSNAFPADKPHLPPETPTSATMIVCLDMNQHARIMVMILVYPHGEVLRVTEDNLDEYFETPLQLVQYSMRAQDKIRYTIPCLAPAST